MGALVNHQVRLVSRPQGIPQAEHFALATEPMPAPGKGEILIRSRYLSVDPAQRGWANDEGNYSAPVPLDTPMRALTVGEIIESNAPEFQAGEFVYGWFGWQIYCVTTPGAVLRRVQPSALPLSANLSLLGINGLTAYLALHGLGDPKPGEHVLVSTAAGSVGRIDQAGKFHERALWRGSLRGWFGSGEAEAYGTIPVLGVTGALV